MSNKALQTFDFNDKTVRVIMRDGEPWWVARDVATILDFKDAWSATQHLDNDEKGTSKISTPGGEQEMTVINESWLYNLIFRSSKPEAKRFRKWVTHEVLPQIRKSGMYISNELLIKMQREINKLQDQINSMYAVSVLGSMVLAQKGSVTLQSAAQFLAQHGLDIGQNRLFRFCRNKKLLCSRKGRQWNKPTQKAIEKGLLNLEVNSGFHAITMVTPEGMKYLANELGSDQYPLLMLIDAAD